MQKLRLHLILCSLVATLFLLAQPDSRCPVQSLQLHRLPDLCVPRVYHHTLIMPGGEVMVLGGHTTGFIPTATGEYLHDGEWHTFQTIYAHDDGLALPLADGRILMAGGYKESLGVGQMYEAEYITPSTHQCQPLGIMDISRAQCSAIQLQDGRILVSGNWWRPDDVITQYDGREKFLPVRAVGQPRSHPYLLRTAPDDAIVFGSKRNYYGNYDTILVDRLSTPNTLCPPPPATDVATAPSVPPFPE